MVLGVSRQFRTRKSQGGSTRFHPLEDVVLELVLVRFLVDHPHLVLDTEARFHVVDFHRDVGADLTLHHKARVIMQ